MSLFKELKRRNVFRVAGIYAVVGWILMQVASSLEASLKLPEWFDSVITAGLLIGFPIAVLLAWAFEMTPEGVKRTEDESQDNQSVTSNKMDGLILIGIVAILGMGIWQQMSPKQGDSRLRGNDEIVEDNNRINQNNRPVIPAKAGIQKEEPETILDNSIAVLPFADLSQAGDQEYFSDGIAEEILNVLVRVDALKVTSRTSAFQFKGSQKGIPAIAEELKVRHVVEGSVRKSGDTIRITAQLINTLDDKHLWSETYDRALTTENIFAIQDEISNAIVNALKEELNLQNTETIQVKKTTENLTAYELYLQARPLFLSRKKLDMADEFLIKAIELDSEYAEAWAMRAALTLLKNEYGFTQLPHDETDQKGIEYANQALSLDPNSVLALAVKADILFKANVELRGTHDYAGILSDFNKALSIEPKNATTLLWTGTVYQHLGFVEEALQFFRQCIESEPLYRPCIGNFIFQNEYQGKYELAVASYLKYLKLGVITRYHSPAVSLAALNQELAFILGINTEEYFKGWSRNGEIYQAYKNPELDYSELINEAVNWANENNKDEKYWSTILSPIGYEPSTEIIVYPFYVVYENINSSQIKTYLRNSNVVTYWRQHGFPPQCKPLGEDDFECE